MTRCSLAKLTADGFDTTTCEPLRLGIDTKSVDMGQLIEALASINDEQKPGTPPVMPNIKAALLQLARAIVNVFKRV